ncbi:hypothetical protein D1AOALGA4SA_6984 [Olavius algarvensis Delta 1 endosymbiont]|nr:hypothetical protein D1AOALGA4SA_6984 [Olavius algarvensis Delta 1 endosymbiont]
MSGFGCQVFRPRRIAGQTSGRSNRKRKSGATDVECRLTNVQLRNSLYFNCLKNAERSDSTIRQSSFIEVSYKEV